jgi:hypothetical protein
MNVLSDQQDDLGLAGEMGLCGRLSLRDRSRRSRAGFIGPIQSESSEQRATHEIADSHWDLIPNPPIRDAHFSAQKYPGRNDEHIDDRMLKSLSKEDKDRQPRSNDLSDGRTRGHSHNHPERYHPVAKDGFNENRS